MKLNPYIMYSGNAEEALNFYKECFNGEITELGRYGESPMESPRHYKDKILHARFMFSGNLIMVSDGLPGKDIGSDSNIQLSVDVPESDELDRLFNKLSEGGKITMPLQDTFWGARFGMLTDKFGIKWMLNYDKKN